MNRPIKILFLAANPVNTSQLRLGEEIRSIQAELDRAKYRDRLEIVSHWAVRVGDLSRALLDYKPQIVHFSGHGQGQPTTQAKETYREDITYQSATDASRKFSVIEQSVSMPEGLVLEDDRGQAKRVGAAALAGLFELFQNEVKCVMLNACYSQMQAAAIHQYIDCVVGMNKAIGDQAAIRFATEFYKALATGTSFEFAYQFAQNSLDLYGIPESLTPVLQNRRGIDDPFGLITSPPDSQQLVTQPEAQPKPSAKQGQSFGNITFSGSNNPLSAVEAIGNVNVNQSSNRTTGENGNLEAALAALAKLKEQVVATAELSTFARKDAQAKIEMLQEELQKPQPDKSFVDEVVAALQQGLNGVLTLTGPVTQVATLVAKAWMGLP
jgi:hypothetical protein